MIKIDEPFHGSVLNHRLGRVADGVMKINVTGTAPLGDRVWVNGIEARRAGGRFEAEIPLKERETDIIAKSCGVIGEAEHRIRVIWDRNSKPRYRFSIDDNSFFLRDILQRNYRSLFDCFYLRILRELNRKYGTKFVLNLFYETPEKDFNLSQFPDRYKAEWADNSHWLKLSFHSYAEFPNRPYQYSSAEVLGRDFDLVEGEIRRFAGDETWSTPTVIHWAMVHARAMPALVKRGVKVLSGFFVPNYGGVYTTDAERYETAQPLSYDISYHLDPVRCEYIARCHALKDFETGILFSKADIVCNNTPVEQVVPTLEPFTRDPHTAEVMDLFTHEQYFWPFYKNYRPDHRERCEAAIRFCTERGYEPVFFHEGFLGVPE